MKYLYSLSFFLLQHCCSIVAFVDPRLSKSSTSSSSISYGYDDFYNQWSEENLSSARKERLAREKANKNRFATGKDLTKLRNELSHLRDNLLWAQAVKDEARIEEISKAIDDGERCDAEIVYRKALTTLEMLKKSGTTEERQKEINRWERVAEDARSCLPRFQLEGLWVGDFGQDEFQMINVTYTGDRLVASKVTSDEDFPRGSVIFDADLSPGNNASTNILPPIELPSGTSKKWGVDKLYRYKGKGFVTQNQPKGSKPPAIKHEESQLIMYENHFSFVWVPTRRHVFFGRPSPEVTLRMLRDIMSKEDELENTRKHLEECIDMDMTTSIARTLSNTREPLRRIKRVEELQKLDKKHLNKESLGFPELFNGDIWKSYLDNSLQPETLGFMNMFNRKNWKGFLSGVLDNDEKKEM